MTDKGGREGKREGKKKGRREEGRHSYCSIDANFRKLISSVCFDTDLCLVQNIYENLPGIRWSKDSKAVCFVLPNLDNFPYGHWVAVCPMKCSFLWGWCVAPPQA